MKKNRTNMPGCLVRTVLVLAAVLVIKKMDWLPKNFFSSKPVTIDETPILIKDIRSLGQLITASFYDEVVVDSTIKNYIGPIPTAANQLVIIAKGKVLAGIDLQTLADSNVTVNKDTVWIHLPAAKILDVIINPGDYETFEEKGDWSPEAVTSLKLHAKAIIMARANNKNILDKANTKAKSLIEEFLQAAGFKLIYVTKG
ncbi:MAG: DUF4230 domain-containing protein [Ferruginibacter sp.]